MRVSKSFGMLTASAIGIYLTRPTSISRRLIKIKSQSLNEGYSGLNSNLEVIYPNKELLSHVLLGSMGTLFRIENGIISNM